MARPRKVNFYFVSVVLLSLCLSLFWAYKKNVWKCHCWREKLIIMGLMQQLLHIFGALSVLLQCFFGVGVCVYLAWLNCFTCGSEILVHKMQSLKETWKSTPLKNFFIMSERLGTFTSNAFLAFILNMSWKLQLHFVQSLLFAQLRKLAFNAVLMCANFH